jgi:hypothetical protein
MATEITTRIIINASANKVWEVLTDFNKYAEWNPFITSITGNPEIGNKINVRLVLPGSKGMNMSPRVKAFTTNREFRWLGHLLFTGIFDGEHKFELTDNSDGTTTFIQSEKFKGILVPFLKKMLNGKTVDGFNQMNSALKKRCEN